MTPSLIATFITTQDRQQAVDALRTIEAELESNAHAASRTALPVSFSSQFVHDFEAIQKKSMSEKRLFIQSKIKELIQLKVIRVTVAIPLSIALVERIHHALTSALKTPLCLDIRIDPSMLGGVILSIDGETKAWTLASQIDELVGKELL